MSIFAFCAFLPREFERNRTLSKKTIYRLRKFLGWCIIKLKIRLRIFLYAPVLCLWSSDDRDHDEEFDKGKKNVATLRGSPTFRSHASFSCFHVSTAPFKNLLLRHSFPCHCRSAPSRAILRGILSAHLLSFSGGTTISTCPVE